MTALAASLWSAVLPLALGGESVTETGGSGTAIAIVSVVSIALGYLLLFALWRYVFSEKARARRRKGRSD
jgi:tellurite resistance protein TehA-like permease